MASPRVRDWEEARDLLRKWRETNMRDSELTLQLWDSLLSRHLAKLGDEVYMVYEQVFMAALDCGHYICAQRCLKQLQAEFPDSNRVKKLQAMQLESLKRFEDAEKIYNKILKADETNGVIRKRIVALLKAQNRYSEAIEELSKYLKKFESDYEAWAELADLYAHEQEYGKAAFCMEELIMSSPYNHLHHQRYAELKYSQGGLDNMEIARSYYSQALQLNPANMRALYGLYLSANNIAASPRCGSKKKKENVEFGQWALKQIEMRLQKVSDDESESRELDMDDTNQHIATVLRSLATLQVT